MISAPAFPPPDPADPDEVGWPLCTAAAMWRGGRYAEAIGHVETAAAAAAVLGNRVRAEELSKSVAVLGGYVRDWHAGTSESPPTSVDVSSDYPSIEVLEIFAEEADTSLDEIEELVRTSLVPPARNLPVTLPAGGGDTPRRSLPPLKLLFERAAPPRILDVTAAETSEPSDASALEPDDEALTGVRTAPPPRR